MKTFWFLGPKGVFIQNYKLEICSCPFVRYFRMLFWDDITKIYWWKSSKQTSYWSKTGFFSQLKSKQCFHPKLSWYHPKITYENDIHIYKLGNFRKLIHQAFGSNFFNGRGRHFWGKLQQLEGSSPWEQQKGLIYFHLFLIYLGVLSHGSL